MNTGVVLIAVLAGGLIKGLNGFGYALVSTSLLATAMPAQQAVALMIIPVIIANIELTSHLSIEELKICLCRFKLYIISSFAGVTLGMLLIGHIPSLMLKRMVGLFILAFVASSTPLVSEVFSSLKNFCIENRRTEPFLGLLSGFVFGSSNAGIPVVAYFKALDLSREKFVAVVAVTILGASILRIGLASAQGFYEGPERIIFSATLGLAGLLSVKAGDYIGRKIPANLVENASLVLMLIIGLKLLGTF